MVRTRIGLCYCPSLRPFQSLIKVVPGNKRYLLLTGLRLPISTSRNLSSDNTNSTTTTTNTTPRRQSWSRVLANNTAERPVWSEEWRKLGLGITLVDEPVFPANLFFVQMGFGVDQHGESHDATKAAVRAVRNAIEFNSIPGVITHLPGGRSQMLVHVKLGIPPMGHCPSDAAAGPMFVDVLQVAKVFPYGRLLPIEICVGGLAFHTGRVVEELGDSNDVGVCVVACVSLGYGNDPAAPDSDTPHRTYSTREGY